MGYSEYKFYFLGGALFSIALGFALIFAQYEIFWGSIFLFAGVILGVLFVLNTFENDRVSDYFSRNMEFMIIFVVGLFALLILFSFKAVSRSTETWSQDYFSDEYDYSETTYALSNAEFIEEAGWIPALPWLFCAFGMLLLLIDNKIVRKFASFILVFSGVLFLVAYFIGSSMIGVYGSGTHSGGDLDGYYSTTSYNWFPTLSIVLYFFLPIMGGYLCFNEIKVFYSK